MATESGFIGRSEKAAEKIGFEGKKKTKFLTQGWKMIQENEVRKLAAETEERKLKLAAEAKERKLAAEAEAAERGAERRYKLEMEKLRLESERLNEQRSALSEDQQAAFSQASQNAVVRTKASVLPGFVDGKDNLDSYLLRFEGYASIAGWERSDWATRLSSLLSGRALDVYSGSSDE